MKRLGATIVALFALTPTRVKRLVPGVSPVKIKEPLAPPPLVVVTPVIERDCAADRLVAPVTLTLSQNGVRMLQLELTTPRLTSAVVPVTVWTVLEVVSPVPLVHGVPKAAKPIEKVELPSVVDPTSVVTTQTEPLYTVSTPVGVIVRPPVLRGIVGAVK
jgi:hypothetical protein